MSLSKIIILLTSIVIILSSNNLLEGSIFNNGLLFKQNEQRLSSESMYREVLDKLQTTNMINKSFRDLEELSLGEFLTNYGFQNEEELNYEIKNTEFLSSHTTKPTEAELEMIEVTPLLKSSYILSKILFSNFNELIGYNKEDEFIERGFEEGLYVNFYDLSKTLLSLNNNDVNKEHLNLKFKEYLKETPTMSDYQEQDLLGKIKGETYITSTFNTNYNLYSLLATNILLNEISFYKYLPIDNKFEIIDTKTYDQEVLENSLISTTSNFNELTSSNEVFISLYNIKTNKLTILKYIEMTGELEEVVKDGNLLTLNSGNIGTNPEIVNLEIGEILEKAIPRNIKLVISNKNVSNQNHLSIVAEIDVMYRKDSILKTKKVLNVYDLLPDTETEFYYSGTNLKIDNTTKWDVTLIDSSILNTQSLYLCTKTGDTFNIYNQTPLTDSKFNQLDDLTVTIPGIETFNISSNRNNYSNSSNLNLTVISNLDIKNRVLRNYEFNPDTQTIMSAEIKDINTSLEPLYNRIQATDNRGDSTGHYIIVDTEPEISVTAGESKLEIINFNQTKDLYRADLFEFSLSKDHLNNLSIESKTQKQNLRYIREGEYFNKR